MRTRTGAPTGSRCLLRSQTIYARSRESNTVSRVKWEAGIECIDTDMGYCQTGAQTHAHWPASLFFKVWIKLQPRCHVNMKAFTALKKSRLWLEFDVWRGFLNVGLLWQRPFFVLQSSGREPSVRKYVGLKILSPHAPPPPPNTF